MPGDILRSGIGRVAVEALATAFVMNTNAVDSVSEQAATIASNLTQNPQVLGLVAGATSLVIAGAVAKWGVSAAFDLLNKPMVDSSVDRTGPAMGIQRAAAWMRGGGATV